MICSNCGTQNPVGQKFCAECASRLSVACPSCGHPGLPTAKFCGECATPLPGDTLSPTSALSLIRSDAAPVAERRLVSILFADLVGFTTLAEGRDAEDTRELLSRYFDLSRDVIVRYGGMVEKFIGDAVMAVWGAPIAHEDDAERAVRAALELVDAVRTLGPSIPARAGVLTGEAAVTLGAVDQGIVAGDLQFLAQRGDLTSGGVQLVLGAAGAFDHAGDDLNRPGGLCAQVLRLGAQIAGERAGGGRRR